MRYQFGVFIIGYRTTNEYRGEILYTIENQTGSDPVLATSATTPGERRKYLAPQLSRYGSVATLTHGSQNNGNDPGAGRKN